MAAKKSQKKVGKVAPKPYSKNETAYQKALRSGSQRSAAAHRKGYVAYSSPEGLKRREKARVASEKYRKSKWALADDIATELLIAMTSAREVKKVMRGEATKADIAKIAGTAATYAVPYSKINKGINAVVGGKAVKNAVSASKAKSAVKGSKTAAKRIKAGAAGAGAAGRKTIRGAAKTANYVLGATAADAYGQKITKKVLRARGK